MPTVGSVSLNIAYPPEAAAEPGRPGGSRRFSTLSGYSLPVGTSDARDQERASGRASADGWSWPGAECLLFDAHPAKQTLTSELRHQLPPTADHEVSRSERRHGARTKLMPAGGHDARCCMKMPDLGAPLFSLASSLHLDLWALLCGAQENGEPLMSLPTLVTLAELHYRFGLIGIAEYEERCRIAEWLYGGSVQHVDPRDAGDEERERGNEGKSSSGNSTVRVRRGDPNDPHDPGYASFLFNDWVFTKADPDPYPSTPHGHWQSQNNKWPKLDPYNGRVFKAKHNEDVPKRLNRSRMKIVLG